jgi:23S rRNA (guanosine2251-2'-O)-methyltransferase
VAHAIPGRGPVAEALRAGRDLTEVVIDTRAGPELVALGDTAREAGIAVRRADRTELERLAAGVLHQGVVALTGGFEYRSLDELTALDLVVVLDGITDPQNLGAIARSAEAAGADAIIVRERRGVHVTPAAEKASAGALSWIAVAVVGNITRTLGALADRGCWSVGLAGEAEQTLWDCGLLDGPVALVIGAEGAGLSRLVAERVDALVRIPMGGAMTSLNASAAAAVSVYEVRRRRHGATSSQGVRTAH